MTATSITMHHIKDPSTIMVTTTSTSPNTITIASTVKPQISFSIENILAPTCRTTNEREVVNPYARYFLYSFKDRNEQEEYFQTNFLENNFEYVERRKADIAHYPQFDWLQCTRYKPPKVMRAKRKKSIATRSNRQPRIPFSPYQQATLENQFRVHQYLTSHLLHELSAILKLSKQRIKIWYQNRRARDRRDKQMNEETIHERKI